MSDNEAELTVEAALKELQKLTPHVCEIAYRTAGIATIRMTIHSDSIIPATLFNAYGESLSDCLAQVRVWKAKEHHG